MDRNITETGWYIFYTHPRAEKVVYNELLKMNYDALLPMIESLRIWKNRQRKMVQQVLFPGYIFVNTEMLEIENILRVPKVSTCIKCDGVPSKISDSDIKRIKDLICSGNEVTAESYQFSEGETVRIVSGPLCGYEGVLLKQKGKTRFGIQINQINQMLCVDICSSWLERSKEVI